MESIFTHHAVLLIRAEDREAVNAEILAVAPDAGETFQAGRGASPTGQGQPTHLFAGVQMRDDHFALCEQMAAQFVESAVRDATSATALETLEGLLAERGLVVVEVEE